jgi:hypothetical protein
MPYRRPNNAALMPQALPKFNARRRALCSIRNISFTAHSRAGQEPRIQDKRYSGARKAQETISPVVE